MRQQSYQIANIFGLDVNNKQHSIAIVDALNGIADAGDFVIYCREKRSEIKFASKTEKLDAIAYAYKKEQLEKRLPHDKARLYAKRLSDKVAMCRGVVEERHCKFYEIRLDGENYFADHELRALDSIGTVSWVIELSRLGDLEDEICKAYIAAKRDEFVQTKRIGTDKKVSSMIAVKGM